MNINIKTIPHKEHRYPTVGDWWFEKDGTLQIRVSKLGNWRYEALIVVHELVEVLICKHARVTQKQVDKFDMMFENEREQGLHGDEEPGDDPDAPYKFQHGIATGVERILAVMLGVCWRKYEMAINKLP